VIAELAMISFGVRVSRGADILELPLFERRLVFRQGRSFCECRRRAASAQKKGADGGAKQGKISPITQ
jgi:hypothetical protein